MKELGQIQVKIWLALVTLFMSVNYLAGQKLSDDQKAKEMIRQWIATERLLSEELNTWKKEKASTKQLLELYQKELKLLNEELEKTGKSVVGVDKKKSELEAKLVKAKQARLTLKAFLAKLRPRVIALGDQFPEPLKLQVMESINQLNGVNDETSVRDILQATVNVLEQASIFNAGITQTRETIKIGTAEGSEKLNAEVIYFGLGRAYFVVGDKAGIGKPTAKGWAWERRDTISSQVKKAVEVFNKSKQPQLVELPVQITP